MDSRSGRRTSRLTGTLGLAGGEPGLASRPARAVTIKIAEAPGTMSFSPDKLVVKKGEQVRFTIVNDGIIRHEFVLDSGAHGAMMRMLPAMEYHDLNGKAVDPGQSATMLWRFSKSGTYEFACLIARHDEAGMRGTIKVTP